MIVVTGSSGLLGASVLCRARDRKLKVAGLCHRHVLRVPEIEIFPIDLCDETATRRLLLALRPESIIHCAAATNVDWCEDHRGEADRMNGKVSGEIAKVAAELNARFIYVSTDAVFDGHRGNYSEEDQPSPINAYARSKLCGERRVKEEHPRAAVARLTLYGWNVQNKLSLAEWVVQRLREGEEVPGFTDVYFTPSLATDLADCLLDMLERDLTGIYHVGSPDKIDKYHFARLVSAAFDFPAERVKRVRLAEASLRAERPRDVSLNTAKIRSALQRDLPDVRSGISTFHRQFENGYAQTLKSYLPGDGQ